MEILAARCERVLGAGWYLGVDFLPDDTVFCELIEPGRQRAGTDAIERSEQIAPAFGTREKVADNEDGPLLPDDIERGFYGARY